MVVRNGRLWFTAVARQRLAANLPTGSRCYAIAEDHPIVLRVQCERPWPPPLPRPDNLPAPPFARNSTASPIRIRTLASANFAVSPPSAPCGLIVSRTDCAQAIRSIARRKRTKLALNIRASTPLGHPELRALLSFFRR